MTELAGHPLFWFQRAQNPLYFDRCERLFERLGCHFPRLPEPQDHAFLLGLVAAGNAFAIVPQSLTLMGRPGVVYRDLTPDEGADLHIHLALAHRTDDRRPELTELIKLTQQCLGV